MITFNNIVERFQIFADNHFFIKSFSFGSPDDVDLSKFTDFPLMHLVYTGATYDAGTKTYNLEVYILDIPNDKKGKVTPQKEAISDSEQCAEDIIADIRNGGNIFLFAQDYEVVNATTTPLEEETKNVLSGILLDISVAIPYEWDACNAPIDGVEPGGTEVTYARRGILRMLTIDGATDVTSVRTINVTNGTLTDDGDGVVTLDTGGVETLAELTDVNVAGVTDNQVLSYDSATSKWVPADDAQGSVTSVNGQTGAVSLALRNLSDVDLDTTPPTDGQSLIFSSSGSEWIAGDAVHYHDRYQTESEALRAGATATVELYYSAQGDGDGLAESASSDTPTAGYVINRKIYYSEAGFADPDTGTWVEFTPAPADDASFATVKAALLEYLKARTGGTVPISLKQTWVEVAAAPAFTGLLNETYGSGAAAAYSVRWLNGNYTGAAMKIRRASDSTTTNISFRSDGDIDEAGITTFCTGTTCTILTWYDQSQTGGTGSGNDATAASTGEEPTIYTGGAIVKENGKVGIDFDGSDVLTHSSDIALAACSIFTTLTAVAAIRVWYGETDQNYLATFSSNVTSAASGSQRNAAHTPSGQTLYNYTRNGSVGGTWYKNSSALTTTGAQTSETLTLNDIGGFGAYKHVGPIQEIITYNTDKSTDRTDIESNVGDYFTQNTPLLDTYTGAAACYSLRLMRTAYTGDCIEVYNGSSYADIGFNVFGELDTVSLADHCGSSDGTIRTWYDQSGNANDAAQTSTAAMPKIYDGATATVVTENGKPAIDHQGTGYLDVAASISDPFTMSVVMKHAGSSQYMVGGSLKPSFYFSGSTLRVFGGSWSNVGARSTSQANYVGIYDAAGTGEIIGRVNTTETIGTTAATTYTPAVAYQIGASGSGGYIVQETMQEVVIWNSNQKSATNIDGIQTNVNSFYSIY